MGKILGYYYHMKPFWKEDFQCARVLTFSYKNESNIYLLLFSLYLLIYSNILLRSSEFFLFFNGA
jgi:hypothetical protein